MVIISTVFAVPAPDILAASSSAEPMRLKAGVRKITLTPTLAVAGWSAEGGLPGHDEPGLPSWVFNNEQQNMTGHPAISLPAGRAPNGVPFGLQVTAPRLREDLLFGFAAAWEAARPWPPAADGYRPFGE
jgi:Asp-tRNA(Asn)/Glu-tRNA(Gln) amidotransferase A subunit family amidase